MTWARLFAWRRLLPPGSLRFPGTSRPDRIAGRAVDSSTKPTLIVADLARGDLLRTIEASTIRFERLGLRCAVDGASADRIGIALYNPGLLFDRTRSHVHPDPHRSPTTFISVPVRRKAVPAGYRQPSVSRGRPGQWICRVVSRRRDNRGPDEPARIRPLVPGSEPASKADK